MDSEVATVRSVRRTQDNVPIRPVEHFFRVHGGRLGGRVGESAEPLESGNVNYLKLDQPSAPWLRAGSAKEREWKIFYTGLMGETLHDVILVAAKPPDASLHKGGAKPAKSGQAEAIA